MLVVEDDPGIAASLVLGLERAGYRVRGVGTGREALAAVPEPDVVLLDSMTGVPALVLGRRMDVLAWNGLGAALITDFGELPPERRNYMRLAFLDPDVRGRYAQGESMAQECVAYLGMEADRYPEDHGLARLVGELPMRDADSRRWWSDCHVRAQRYGRKEFVHPVAGDPSLGFQVLDVRSAADQNLIAYTAEPGSRSSQALTFLAGRATAERPAPRP